MMGVPKCPRDAKALTIDELNPHQGHSCGDCGGTLLSEIGLLGALGFPQGTTIGTRGVASLHKLPFSTAACPHGHGVMHAVIHRTVQVDICPGCHALWLDKREFEKITETEIAKRARHDRGSLHFDISDAVGFIGEAVISILGWSRGSANSLPPGPILSPDFEHY